MKQKVSEKLSVTPKTAAKIGLVTSIFVIMSSIMGVGIFFKNGAVFRTNGGNPYGILVSWILTGIIAIFTAISFSEVVTVKQKENFGNGLGGYVSELNGYNIGRATRIWMPTFYYAAKLMACSIYIGTTFVYLGYCMTDDPRQDWLGSAKDFTTLVIMAIGMTLVGIFITINYFSEKAGPALTRVLTVLKFVPIVLVAVVAIVAVVRNDAGGWAGKYYNQEDPTKFVEVASFDIAQVLNCIPGIMFTFDGFLCIGNIANKVNKPEKNVSLALIFGMIIVIALNIIVTVSLITIGSANPFGLFMTAFVAGGASTQTAVTAAKWLALIMALLIIASGLGPLNSYCMIAPQTCKEGVESETYMFGKQMKKIQNGNTRLAGTLYFAGIMLFYYLGFGIPSCILNTIQIFDGTGATIVLFFFGIYAYNVFGGIVNRRTKKHEVRKFKAFPILAPIAVIGCAFVFLYSLVYTYTLQPVTGMNNAWTVWGLAFTPSSWNETRANGGTNLYAWEAMIVFWVTIAFFISYPFINDAVLKATNKEYPHALIWQKNRHFETVVEIDKNKAPEYVSY